MAVYACSDLHGQKNLLEQIKQILGPNDTVYFLGDAGDRGRHGWQMIKDIANDSRFIYLKGNHEDMLAAAAKEYFKFDHIGSDYHLLVRNGGYDTFNDMLVDPMAEKWISYINHLPTYKIYNNAAGQTIFLSHAGFTPWMDEDGAVVIPEDKDLIWNRDHYLWDWKEDEMFPNSIVVHGHTPIPYLSRDLRYDQRLKENQTGPFWYADNHKVCLDNAAFVTNIAFLLNLDTFEYIEFKGEAIEE